MKTMQLSAAATIAAVASLWAVQPAHGEGKSREEVKAELAEAVRTGDVATGDGGLTRYELAPERYPARPKPAGKSRDQVAAELAEAIADGGAIVGEAGLTRSELESSARAPRPALPGKTRQQVRAELAEAVRTGDVEFGEAARRRNAIDPARYPQDVLAEHLR